MDIELDAIYEDRQGLRWRIVSITNQQIAPVVAARWEGKSYHTRTFKRDGSYWGTCEDRWDLIRKVS